MNLDASPSLRSVSISSIASDSFCARASLNPSSRTYFHNFTTEEKVSLLCQGHSKHWRRTVTQLVPMPPILPEGRGGHTCWEHKNTSCIQHYWLLCFFLASKIYTRPLLCTVNSPVLITNVEIHTIRNMCLLLTKNSSKWSHLRFTTTLRGTYHYPHFTSSSATLHLTAFKTWTNPERKIIHCSCMCPSSSFIPSFPPFLSFLPILVTTLQLYLLPVSYLFNIEAKTFLVIFSIHGLEILGGGRWGVWQCIKGLTYIRSSTRATFPRL